MSNQSYTVKKSDISIFNNVKSLIPNQFDISTTLKQEESQTIDLMNNKQAIYYDSETDNITLANNYVDLFLDTPNINRNYYREFNDIFNNKDYSHVADNDPIIKNFIDRQNLLMNNANKNNREIYLTHEQKEIAKEFIIAHELGHAVFNKYSSVNFNPNNVSNGFKYSKNEIESLNRALNVIETTRYAQSSNDAKLDGLYSLNPSNIHSLKLEVQADTFASYLLLKKYGDKNPVLNDFFEKIKDLRDINNDLRYGVNKNGTHNTGIIFERENLSKINKLVNLGGTVGIKDFEKLNDQFFIDILKKDGLVLEQFGHNIKNTKTFKDAFKNELSERLEASKYILSIVGKENNCNQQLNTIPICQQISNELKELNNVESDFQKNKKDSPITQANMDALAQTLDSLNIKVLVTDGIESKPVDMKFK